MDGHRTVNRIGFELAGEIQKPISCSPNLIAAEYRNVSCREISLVVKMQGQINQPACMAVVPLLV